MEVQLLVRQWYALTETNDACDLCDWTLKLLDSQRFDRHIKRCLPLTSSSQYFVNINISMNIWAGSIWSVYHMRKSITPDIVAKRIRHLRSSVENLMANQLWIWYIASDTWHNNHCYWDCWLNMINISIIITYQMPYFCDKSNHPMILVYIPEIMEWPPYAPDNWPGLGWPGDEYVTHRLIRCCQMSSNTIIPYLNISKACFLWSNSSDSLLI